MNHSRRGAYAGTHPQPLETRTLTCQQPIALRDIDQRNDQGALGRGVHEPRQHRLRSGIGYVIRDHVHDHAAMQPFAKKSQARLFECRVFWRMKTLTALGAKPVELFAACHFHACMVIFAIWFCRTDDEQKGITPDRGSRVEVSTEL